MPYDTNELKRKAIAAITDKELIFVEDICAHIGVAKSTFYVHFPIGSEDNEEMVTMLETNKINQKIKLRKKWGESDNFTAQVTLYKLCATPEELKRLQMTYIDHTTDGKAIDNNHTVEFVNRRKKDA